MVLTENLVSGVWEHTCICWWSIEGLGGDASYIVFVSHAQIQEAKNGLEQATLILLVL